MSVCLACSFFPPRLIVPAIQSKSRIPEVQMGTWPTRMCSRSSSCYKYFRPILRWWSGYFLEQGYIKSRKTLQSSYYILFSDSRNNFHQESQVSARLQIKGVTMPWPSLASCSCPGVTWQLLSVHRLATCAVDSPVSTHLSCHYASHTCSFPNYTALASLPHSSSSSTDTLSPLWKHLLISVYCVISNMFY